MLYYVDQNAVSSGNGSKESPFLTISEAASLACAGDEILVAPGIYREEVVPANGGIDEAHRIIYRSLEKGKAVILGSESVKNWEKVEGTVWRAEFAAEYFASYNPYTTPIQGDWYFASNPLHTGEIYLGEKSLYEVMTLEEVKNPKVYGASWDPEFTVYCYYTCQENGKTVLYANFHEYDPNLEDVEINVRRRCFFPEKEGLNYITVSGFTMGRAATNWAPPTAFQDGLIGPNWAKGWIIEDCEIYDSKCSGISLGKYYQKNNNNKWST
ncbi:MAG: hypothetical protein Q4E53_07340, partial [Eubacteriales bacterium]|nr:hypothetical protein [Eubacteriales bacterium]